VSRNLTSSITIPTTHPHRTPTIPNFQCVQFTAHLDNGDDQKASCCPHSFFLIASRTSLDVAAAFRFRCDDDGGKIRQCKGLLWPPRPTETSIPDLQWRTPMIRFQEMRRLHAMMTYGGITNDNDDKGGHTTLHGWEAVEDRCLGCSSSHLCHHWQKQYDQIGMEDAMPTILPSLPTKALKATSRWWRILVKLFHCSPHWRKD